MTVIAKNNPKLKGCKDVYLKDVTMYYARVHEPMDKHTAPKPGVGNQSKRNYSVTVFFDEDDRTALEDKVMINKQIFEVGKDKNKKRQIKFPLYKTDANGNEVEAFAGVDGLHGMQVIQHEFNKKGNPNQLIIVDSNSNPITENIGNGSKGHIKLFGYTNEEGLLNVLLTTIVVTDLVPYEGGGSGEIVDDELGISIKTPEKKAVDEFSESATEEPPFDMDGDDEDF